MTKRELDRILESLPYLPGKKPGGQRRLPPVDTSPSDIPGHDDVPHDHICPACDGENVSRLRDKGRVYNRRRCRDCGRRWNMSWISYEEECRQRFP